MAIKKNNINSKVSNDSSKGFDDSLNSTKHKRDDLEANSIEDIDNEKLEQIDGLGPEDDFKSFLTEQNSDNIKLAAFRKLWKSNPFFNTRDGLNDYDEDFKLLNSIGTDFMQAFYKIDDTYDKNLKKLIQNKNKKVENLSESYNEENVEVENNTNEDEKNKET